MQIDNSKIPLLGAQLGGRPSTQQNVRPSAPVRSLGPDNSKKVRLRGLVLGMTMAAALAAALAACSSSPSTTKPPATHPAAPAAVATTGAAATSAPAAAASALSGTWSGQYSGAYTGTFTLHWTQSGQKLSGRIMLSTPAVMLGIHGTVQGGAIRFGTVGSTNITYSGSVSGNSMSGTYQVVAANGSSGGPWSATKS